jgi:hypothetical protein
LVLPLYFYAAVMPALMDLRLSTLSVSAIVDFVFNIALELKSRIDSYSMVILRELIINSRAKNQKTCLA